MFIRFFLGKSIIKTFDLILKTKALVESCHSLKESASGALTMINHRRKSTIYSVSLNGNAPTSE